MNKIVLLYGLPCTGKSSICDLFIEPLIHQIRTDKVWREIFQSPKYDAVESEIVFSTVMEKLNNEMLLQQPFILVEGVFASIERLFEIKNATRLHNYKLFSVLLFASLHCLHLRNAARSTSMDKLPDGKIDLLNNRFNSREFCDLAINTENSSQENTVLLIKTLIEDGR